jgi:hypothetical protein
MRRVSPFVALALVLAMLAGTAGQVLAGHVFHAGGAKTRPTRVARAVPRYNHIALIVEENQGYAAIIGNKYAPNINNLARTYGLATKYFSVGDPSQPNYVALLGGSTFGIGDDLPYYLHPVTQTSIAGQLDAAGLTWKAYLQSLPYPGYTGQCFPVRCDGTPDTDGLYASKHVGFPIFTEIQNNPSEFAKLVPVTQLDRDLANGTMPNFSLVVPDQCHDMHGAPPYCVDSGPNNSVTNNHLIQVADGYVNTLVNKITSAAFWSTGNNAIVITWDEGRGKRGCCDAVPGTGQIVTIVITNHGPRGLQDPTPYNHYSLLQTIQDAFGLGCLQFTCDKTNVTPMAPLFAQN